MAEYESIHGTRVKYLTSDPTLTDSSTEGQVWYNSTSGVNKSLVQIKAWSSGGNLPTATNNNGSATQAPQSTALSFGGGATTSQTIEYNGYAWTTSGNLGTGRFVLSGAGVQTAALGFGGYRHPPGVFENATEEYDGSSWTAGGNLGTARASMGGNGTQTAALAVTGAPLSPGTQCEEYGGTSWTAGGAYPVAQQSIAVAGPQTAALGAGGISGGPENGSTLVCNYDGSSWTVVSGTIPNGQNRAAYAGTQTHAVVFGGNINTPPPAGPGTPGIVTTATNEWDGSTFAITANMATARQSYAGGGTATAAIGFAGDKNPGASNDTEEYSSNILSPRTGVWAASTNLPGTRDNGSVSQSGTTSAAYYAGGSNPGAPYTPDTPTIEYNGSSWTAGGNLSTGRISAGSGGTLTAGLTWGGFQGPGVGDNTNTTEEYNGTSWTGGGNLPTPQRECYGDGTQTDSIFGGSFGAPNVTALKYDGSSWTAISNLPAGRFGAAGAGNSSAFVLAGGAPNKTTLEWNGSSWGAGGDVPTSPLFAMAAGGTQTSALFYGGEGGSPSGLLAGTFFYNGTAMESRSNMTQSQSTDNSGDAGSCLAIGGGSPAISVEEWDESAAGTATASTLTTS